MQMRLPLDKLLDARAKIHSLYQRKKVTLRDLQSLIGTLNFACKVIVPGRTFLCRLINLTVGVANPNHLIRLTSRPDLIWRPGNSFLTNSMASHCVWWTTGCHQTVSGSIRMQAVLVLLPFMANVGYRENSHPLGRTLI